MSAVRFCPWPLAAQRFSESLLSPILSIVPLLSPALLGLEPRGHIFDEISLRFLPEVEAWDSEAIDLAGRHLEPSDGVKAMTRWGEDQMSPAPRKVGS